MTYRGVRLDRYTIYNLERAERIAKRTFTIAQGSYNQGGVSASAGTHDGGGALDVDVRGLSGPQVTAIVRALRRASFAAWRRTVAQGFDIEHVHAILIGNKKAAPLAKQQVTSYKRGNDGLGALNVRDPSTFRPTVKAAPYAMRFRVVLPGASKELRMVGRTKASHDARVKRRDGQPVLVAHGDVLEIKNVGRHWSRSIRDAFYPNDRLKRI